MSQPDINLTGVVHQKCAYFKIDASTWRAAPE